MPARLLTDATLATMAGEGAYGLVPKAAVVLEGERIAWAGALDALPAAHAGLEAESLGGRLITPAPIDCHTHLIFGGDRAREFEMRLEGASYEEVARAGGGILSTVRATRAASEEALVASALPRLDALIAEGVTCVEIKSGYGLDQETEFRMLRAAKRLGQMRPVRVELTYLGAHAIPPEYAGQADAFIDHIVLPSLDRAAGLFDTVDGFCEGIAFSPAQIRRVFEAARAKGMRVKLHAEQLSNLGGAALAAEFGALSADHLEYLDGAGIQAMATAGTIAVTLPGAFYTLRETQLPPIQGLRDAGVPIALATDCNPGSSPMTSILLVLNMACTLFRMTPEEALAGITRNAARALGRADLGTIEAGKIADLAIWDVAHPAELSYRIGFNPLHRRIFGGQG
ncbi:MAG: imidazolonepropionase [Pseudomonadota bacterium]